MGVDLWMLVNDPDSINLSVAVEMTIMNMVFIFANLENYNKEVALRKTHEVFITCLNLDIIDTK